MTRVMDDKQTRKAVIRWLAYLVQHCPEVDAEMVSDVLGFQNSGTLRSMAQHMIRELSERG